MRKWLAAVVSCTACALSADAGATNPPVVTQPPPVVAPKVLLSKTDAMARVAKLSLSMPDKRPGFAKLIPPALSPPPASPKTVPCTGGVGTFTVFAESISQHDPTAAAAAGTPTNGGISLTFAASQCQTLPGTKVDTGGAALLYRVSETSTSSNQWTVVYTLDGTLNVTGSSTDPQPGTYVFRNMIITANFTPGAIPPVYETITGAVVIDGTAFTFNNDNATLF